MKKYLVAAVLIVALATPALADAPWRWLRTDWPIISFVRAAAPKIAELKRGKQWPLHKHRDILGSSQ